MKILFLLGALLIPTIVYSANDLEKWNSEVGRTVRQTHSEKLAQTTYKEISSKNVTVSQDMKTVYPQIESSAQVAGSKTRVVAEATLVVDKEKVARDWNKKLAKVGKVTNALGAAVVIGGYIMDAVDWVMDPENNTIKKKPDPNAPENTKYSSNFIYYSDRGSAYSLSDYGRTVFAQTVASNSGFSGAVFTSASKHPNYACNFVGNYNCMVIVKYMRNGTSYTQNYDVSIKANPDYKSDYVPESKEVSEAEKEQVLKDILNDPAHADLAKQMIGNSYTIGPDNPEPDPNIVNDIKDAQKGALNSDDPKGDTRTDPKIDSGTQGQADTTPKPDTGTGTNPDPGTGTGTGTPTPNPSPDNGSTTTFELPAFCNYAAKLCDWLDWTQEDKELEEAEKEEPEELDLGTIDKNRFSANGQCPAPKEIDETVKALGRNVKFDFQIEWTPICSVAEDTSPLVLLISTITGLLILVGGGRSSEP
ncbi:virulence factor TspB C-terminal domain-related protein [Acinetobacter johnsonii]|uniref:virulence factor TspB C-terminal domain-related protein n=1 Tax=Acinetobacter johnsonii TaxID=40214 RepID=UPI002D80B859|nr:virulence factor TspB C-terminal domain-related protein [Acinetobacter johnsonii]